jgi:AraC-like DNA-binding protein
MEYSDLKSIEAPTYKSNYYLLKDGGLYIERLQTFEKSGTIFDTFPNIWGLYLIGEIPPNLLSLRTQGKLVEIQGPAAVFVRPFSLVEWVIHKPFQVPWQAICYRTPPPESAPQEATLFQLNPSDQPYSLGQISDMFRQKKVGISVEKIEEYNILAVRLKKHLEQNLTSEKAIPEYACELGINSSTLTRYFKKCFGLAPLQYRNQMRLFSSLISLILDSKDVIEVSNEAGFLNLRNFNKQFLNYTQLQPSKMK